MENEKMNAEKLKVLNSTLEKLEKTFGKGAIMRLSDTPIENIEVISTGSISLDVALGVGGLPKGRVIEIYGPESSGK
ncbi:MAG: DNA recombination/repair protein RecA, partial [Bacteroidales bacterium]